MGVNRKTIIAWESQLQEDEKLIKQVAAHCRNIAIFYEELNALKAISEISRRLVDEPNKVGIGDLVKVKDTCIHNARLIRGDSTQNIQTVSPVEAALEFVAACKRRGLSLADIIEGLDMLEEVGTRRSRLKPISQSAFDRSGPRRRSCCSCWRFEVSSDAVISSFPDDPVADTRNRQCPRRGQRSGPVHALPHT